MMNRLKKKLHNTVDSIVEAHRISIGSRPEDVKTSEPPDNTGLDRGGEPSIAWRKPAPIKWPEEPKDVHNYPDLELEPMPKSPAPPMGTVGRKGTPSMASKIAPFKGSQSIEDHPEMWERVPLDNVEPVSVPLDTDSDDWTMADDVFMPDDNAEEVYQGAEWDDSQPFSNGEFEYKEEPGPEPPIHSSDDNAIAFKTLEDKEKRLLRAAEKIKAERIQKFGR